MNKKYADSLDFFRCKSARVSQKREEDEKNSAEIYSNNYYVEQITKGSQS